MVPKPFPYPLGVGIDVCKVSRIASLLRSSNVRNQWARRVFTRLEWLDVWKYFERTRRAMTDDAEDMTRTDRRATNVQSSWMLPEIPTKGLRDANGVLFDKSALNEDSPDFRSPVATLARFLAGRWAAKEAVIKAHSNRRLYMNQISVVSPRYHPDIFPTEDAQKIKPVALIDPPTNTILMDDRVANLRALRGFAFGSQHLRKDELMRQQEREKVQSLRSVTRDSGERFQVGSMGGDYIERRARVDESERRVAEISISHDGDAAVAVCMAFDQSFPERKMEDIFDDGSSLPFHEPQWGDEGWFSKDYRTEVASEGKAPTVLEE